MIGRGNYSECYDKFLGYICFEDTKTSSRCVEILSYLNISKRLASHLSSKTRISSEKEIIVTYAIEILIINLINVMMTITLGGLLGVWQGTVICLITVAVFRHTAGGAHSKSPWRCAMVTIAIFPLLALLGKHLSGLNQNYTDILSVIGMFVGITSISFLAPVDTPAAPIISPARRKKLKVLSLIVVTLITMIIIFLRQSTGIQATQIQVCLVLSILWVSFILSKWGHRFMSFIDGINVCK